MRPNSQSFGNFLKSFAFSLAIYFNLLFSGAFLIALGFHVMKNRQQAITAEYGKQPKELKPTAVTLAKIP